MPPVANPAEPHLLARPGRLQPRVRRDPLASLWRWNQARCGGREPWDWKLELTPYTSTDRILDVLACLPGGPRPSVARVASSTSKKHARPAVQSQANVVLSRRPVRGPVAETVRPRLHSYSLAGLSGTMVAAPGIGRALRRSPPPARRPNPSAGA